jgi:hypothetical protein
MTSNCRSDPDETMSKPSELTIGSGEMNKVTIDEFLFSNLRS